MKKQIRSKTSAHCVCLDAQKTRARFNGVETVEKSQMSRKPSVKLSAVLNLKFSYGRNRVENH
ncbi:MAG: hypothetical protein ACI9SP_004807 [Arenicella sp.]|jgi:hypothetical protein